MARQRSTGPSSPNSSTPFTARSNATHAITLECVWAAHLPDAFIGLFPDGLQMVHQRLLQRPARLVPAQANASRNVQRVHQLAVDVELELERGRVADAHGTRALVP